jgi:hypothetical protein
MIADLAAFLRARLDDTARKAQEALTDSGTGRWFVGRKWNVYDEGDTTPHDDEETNPLVAYGNTLACSEHIAEHDPARVLAEVDAKRCILAAHPARLPGWCSTCDVPGDTQGNVHGCLTLRLLALPFADHPDYREEWRP